jgi:tetratricopeptide (TPR) repeat protein
MHTRFRLASWAVILGLSLAVVGCGQYSYSKLRGKKIFRDANTLYQQQDYKRAAETYQRVIEADPDLVTAYFFLGNSLDNLYKPSRAGEAENDGYLQQAIQNYKIAAERETDPKMKKLALEYLVNAYGPDKLNDPSQAEPIVKQMISMEPNEPTNYFALAKIYEDSGMYDEAEQILLKAREVRPNEPTVYTTLAGYYNRQGEFEKTIEALEARAAREPDNPEAFHTIATFYWDKTFRDFRLTDAQKKDYVLKGLAAEDKAISLKADYMEALTYKNLLLRVQANLEKDPKVQKELLNEADKLRDRAIELQKKKTAGVGD